MSIDCTALAWQGRDRFVVLATHFGSGADFLATWQAWRDDPQRCSRLVFMAIDPSPLTRDALADAHRSLPHPQGAAALRDAWPVLTPDLHSIDFDHGRVQLQLAIGDGRTWLRELVATVDAFVIEAGADAEPLESIAKPLARLAAPGAVLQISSLTPTLHKRLGDVGFRFEVGAGSGSGEPGTRRATARFESRAPLRHPAQPRSRGAPPDERHALIVGGGLAGCAAAWALAEQGWRSTVLEREARIALRASGNPAGLFHGIVNAVDGAHARFNRAAALSAHAAVRTAVDQHAVPGSTAGLLRLETRLDVAQMRALLQRLQLPGSYVQALDADAASAHAGMRLGTPAWFYAGAGWVQPEGLARSFIERAAGAVEMRFGVDVQQLQRIDSGWRLRDASGRCIAQAGTVVLANAGDAARLVASLVAGLDATPGWPLQQVRGQISLLPGSAAVWPLPRMPLTGAGYVLPEVGGLVAFGATSQPGDEDGSVRVADHRANLAQLERLIGRPVSIGLADLEGRTEWRCTSVDRLPLIGAVPDAARIASAMRLDQPRFVPRLPGLHVITAFGSRGITWCALGARILAARISGAPAPVGSRLLDATDPARFVSRRARREAA